MGRLIVIEGLDGSGKATQAELLEKRLLKLQKPVLKISFPNYESDSSALVKMYLAGDLGGVNDVNVYAVSSFYAVDRYVSFAGDWKRNYENGYTIVSDRYSTSNIVHQMPKLPPRQWDDYITWLDDYEYKRMGLPKPDVVLYLDMSPEVSEKLIKRRYHDDDSKRDIHESDFGYLKRCREVALFAAQKCGWRVIRCDDGENPLNAEEIAFKIFKISQEV